MIYFLLALALVLIAVDLFVRFIVDPMIIASHQKKKASKSYAPRFNPDIKLATETMYDGGKPHDGEESTPPAKEENITNNAPEK